MKVNVARKRIMLRIAVHFKEQNHPKAIFSRCFFLFYILRKERKLISRVEMVVHAGKLVDCINRLAFYKYMILKALSDMLLVKKTCLKAERRTTLMFWKNILLYCKTA